jgi:hypothetical protein
MENGVVLGGKQRLRMQVGGHRPGAWAHVTTDRFRRLALRTFYNATVGSSPATRLAFSETPSRKRVCIFCFSGLPFELPKRGSVLCKGSARWGGR